MSPPRANREPSDPSERLRQLKTELAQQETTLSLIGKQRDELKTDIDDLQKNVDDVKKALADYGAGFKQIESSLQGLQYFFDQKSKMVLAAIGEKREAIHDRIHEYDAETGRMREQLRETAEALAAARNASEEADANQAQRQSEYDKANGYLAAVQDKLKQLDALRGDITKADDATDVASMYFLTLEFKHILEHTQIATQHQLAAKLKEELSELEAAKEHARARKAAWNSLQDDYANQKSALDARVANRRQKLLDTIHALYPVAAH
jgi:chromosome segregation ATPase